MQIDHSDASYIELAWTIPAVIAFIVTILMIVWVWSSFGALRSKIKQSPDLYRAWGPRWNFVLLLLGSLGCFGVSWLGYTLIGVLAMTTPPPYRDEVQEASDLFAWMLIGMEGVQATAQLLLWAAFRALAGQPFWPHNLHPSRPSPLADATSSLPTDTFQSILPTPCPMQGEPPCSGDE